jgi:flagellar biosynthesis/type III secretory pathway chaperone
MSNIARTLSDLLFELRAILEEERRILLSGSPARIAGVVERKLRLAEAIETACDLPDSAPPSVETVISLDRYNRGNSVICAAMLRHLTRTLDRLRQRECHRSYGPDGAEHSPPAQSRLGAA